MHLTRILCAKNRGAIAWNLLQLDFCHKSKINPEAFFIFILLKALSEIFNKQGHF